MMHRRALLVSSVGLVLATALALSGCASEPPIPEGPNGLVKRFKSQANLCVAKMLLDMENVSSVYIGQMQGARPTEIVEDARKSFFSQHKKLRRIVKNEPEVRASITDVNILAVYDSYVSALKAIVAVEPGDVTHDMLSVAYKAATQLEPILD